MESSSSPPDWPGEFLNTALTWAGNPEFAGNILLSIPAPFFLYQVGLTGIVTAMGFILLLLIFSAMISGSEVAFFSLSSREVQHLRKEEDSISQRIVQLLNKPRYLLATILIANNLFNVGIVILSYFVVDGIIGFSQAPVTAFVVNVVGVTFFLVLFGEVLPKVYATQNNLKISRLMSMPLLLLRGLFKPISYFLVTSTRFIERRFVSNGGSVSLEEIDRAIDITSDLKTSKQELKILKGIVKFGNITVKQIMRSRVDVVAVEEGITFGELMNVINESGYSRMPVFKENLDNVIGILYVKDLLSHLEEGSGFRWQSLIRPPFFVPETKKIDDLLKEIQHKRMHLAVVVDEYGGTSGIITLEDILEEVMGDIKDEFDDTAEIIYHKLDNHNYLFEGKTLLNDITKVMGLKSDTFDKVKEDADSLAGLILEIAGKIPAKNDKVQFENFLFTVVSVNKNRIEQAKVTLLEKVGNKV